MALHQTLQGQLWAAGFAIQIRECGKYEGKAGWIVNKNNEVRRNWPLFFKKMTYQRRGSMGCGLLLCFLHTIWEECV